MRIEAKDHIKNKVFPIRISRQEEESLKREAEIQQKSMAELIREGYLERIRQVGNFYEIR